MQSILFHLGPLAVHWYGVLVAVGFLAGMWTAGRRAVRYGIAAETVADLMPWLIGGAILGARTLYVISYWREQFADNLLEILMIQHGGLVYYGGLIGAASAGLLFAWRRSLPTWRLADALAPSIALGYVFGRLGCLMNGCCYGRPTDLPWAIHFPETHITHGIGVHPTQIYDSLISLGFYSFLAWRYRHKTFDGQIFALYLIGYAALRSFVESFRGDYTVHYLGGVATTAQVVGLGILAAGLALYFLLPRPKPPLTPVPRPAA